MGLRSPLRSILNEIFSEPDVAGRTAIGIVTNPKLMEPFQIGLMLFTDPSLVARGVFVNNFRCPLADRTRKLDDVVSCNFRWRRLPLKFVQARPVDTDRLVVLLNQGTDQRTLPPQFL